VQLACQRGYFDHNATTPLDSRVRDAMLPWLGESVGNPSSLHRFGRAAREAVETARDRVAALIGGAAPEIVFTASGTEAANAVVASCCEGDAASSHVVVSSFEHPAIRESAARVERLGGRVTRVDPSASGTVAPQAYERALEHGASLACLMLANNELGTLQPVAEVAGSCRRRGVPLLADAVQAAGKVPVSVEELGVDFLILGAHKFHGPLGAAALWVRGEQDLAPLLVGGGQERGRRSSTPNVPAIVGFGAACELARRELDERCRRLASLRDRFERGLDGIPGARVHCRDAPRLPNTSHVAFAGVDANFLMIRLDLAGFAVSTGSACSSGAVRVSPALAAIGLDEQEARSSLRVSFGATNTAEEVDELLAALAVEVAVLAAG
jgi:cysteine desulfurase